MRRAVFLDRDGVIAHSRMHAGSPRPPVSVDDLVIADDAVEMLARLRRDNFALVVVTNQPDVARGTISRASVDAINAALRDVLDLDAVYVCDHDGADKCDCRKPLPGMLLRAAADLDLDLATSWLIGDRWVDLAAGREAGVRTVLLERSYSWEPTSQGAPPRDLTPDAVGATLSACVDHVLTMGLTVGQE